MYVSVQPMQWANTVQSMQDIEKQFEGKRVPVMEETFQCRVLDMPMFVHRH